MDLIIRQQLEDFGFSANKCVLALPCAPGTCSMPSPGVAAHEGAIYGKIFASSTPNVFTRLGQLAQLVDP